MKFLGEDCHDVAFVNLLCPIMLKYFGPNLAELSIFPKMEYFGKFKCDIYLLIATHHVSSKTSIKWIMKYEVA